MNDFVISERDCYIAYRNQDERRSALSRDYSHYGLFHRLMNFMRSMGYTVVKDPEVLKNFPRIAYSHWYGRKGDLEFCAEYYPAGFKIDFFQNVNIENRNGGRYDFNKWDKMPYRIRLAMICTMRHIREFFNGFPIKDATKRYYTDAESEVKQLFVESLHHPQKSMDFDLHELDGKRGSQYASNNLDRDKKEILNGDIKYTRNYNGYLVRCRVYYDINNMWACILNHDEWIKCACFELFDLTADDVRGRDHRRKEPPKSYLEQMRTLRGMKTKWIENELRRRRRAAHENA